MVSWGPRQRKPCRPTSGRGSFSGSLWSLAGTPGGVLQPRPAKGQGRGSGGAISGGGARVGVDELLNIAAGQT